MPKGAIYCRVSTEEQEANGMSLPYQRESCLRFAESNNLSVPGEYVFLESYSGGFLERPQLDHLRALVKRKEIDFVIATVHDRIARDPFSYYTIQKELSDAGVRLYFSEEKLTGDSATDSFTTAISVWFSQWEREKIKTRTNNGKRQLAKSGGFPFGFSPYGYIKNTKTRELEIFEPEAEIFKRIVRWYLEDGLTLWTIADRLTDEGVPPPSMSEKNWTNQRATRERLKSPVFHWTSTTVQRILSKASIYTGTYQAFKTEYRKTQSGIEIVWERPKEQWIEISIPPLLSMKQAEAILERLESNRRFAKKRAVRSYLLQGKLRCTCQTEQPHFYGYFNNAKGLRNYRCNMHKADKVSEDRRCSNHISGLKIESVVLDTLKELMTHPEQLFSFASDRVAEESGETSDQSDRNRYNEFYASIMEIESKRERAEELYIDGRIKKERLEELLGNLDKEKERISKEMEKEFEMVKSIALKEWAMESWEEMIEYERESIERFFAEASYEELKDLVGLALDRVVVSTEKKEKVARMVFRIPVSPEFASRYQEDEKIEWTDDDGKTHTVGIIPNAPKLLSLDPTKAPLRYRTVEFSGNNGWHGGNGDDGRDGNNPGTPNDELLREEKRLIRMLREKYNQIYGDDH